MLQFMHLHVSSSTPLKIGAFAILKSSALVFSILFLLPSLVAAESSVVPPEIAPDHEIVLKGVQEQPTWMVLWERAREQARLSEYDEAAASYEKLLQEKPHIEEALREYVLVLMHLERWAEATYVLYKLLEIDSLSPEYQLYAGRLALKQQRYEQASVFFGYVYTLSPDGPNSIEALKGMVYAMQKQGRKDLAYPLMEQLYLRVPHEEAFIRQLAQYSLLLGHHKKGLGFYRILLNEFEGKPQDFFTASSLFEETGDLEMAVRCWRGYLESHSYYLPFHKKLSHYYLAHGQERSALPHLLVRLARKEGDPELLLQIGQIYLYLEGRPDKALYYYEEYRQKRPRDSKVVREIKRIQAVLANDLLVIVENEGAWPLWRDLARITPNRLAIYSSMAEQLEEMGKEKELLEVLEIINAHDPGDQDVLFKLAHLYFAKGDLAASAGALDSLKEGARSGGEYFLLRGRIEEGKGALSQALTQYKHYLREVPQDYTVLLKCLHFSSELGLIEELEYFYHLLPGDEANTAVSQEGNIIYGKALLFNGLTSTARLFNRKLLKEQRSDSSALHAVEEDIVQTLLLEEKLFEAEQELMTLLLQRKGGTFLVTQLIHAALLNQDWDRAWKWYEFLVLESDSSERDCGRDSFLLFNKKISILQKSGQLEVAIEMVEDFLQDPGTPCSKEKGKWLDLRLRLAELYSINREYSKAETLIKTIATSSPDIFEMQVLAEAIRGKMAKDNSREHLLEFLAGATDGSTGSLMNTALLLRRYGEDQGALFLVKNYLEEVPDSLRARWVKAQLLAATGDDFAALSLFQELSQEFPGEGNFQQNIYQLQFKLAKFQELTQELAPQWKVQQRGTAPLVEHSIPSAIQSMEIGKQLLLARTFWAERRWDESLLIYESLLQPPVEQLFSERIAREEVELILPPQERTFWNVITFTTPPEPDRLTVVMGPEFIRENLEKPVAGIATELYASYRWQQVVAREVSVRKEMRDGNYYQAMKEYQNILKKDLSTESLFDLAGVYSRLGFLGKEAALYEIIKEESPGYPDLDEALLRNSMKREPRVTLFSAWMEKDGREGYWDNRQLAGGVQGWFMPSLQHEILLDGHRIYNSSEETEQELWRNRLQARMKWSPVYDLDFLLGIGGDRADGNSGSTVPLYNMQIKGRVGDMVQATLGIAQDVVDDTVESLQEAIRRKEYEAGITLDFLPRLFGGGGYLFTEYSDGNHQNRYDFWTSYILHSEPSLLQLRYGYEFSHNSNENQGRDYSHEYGFAPGDHPYWSPKEYWQHLFTISFEHHLAEDVLGRAAPSYYSLEYSLGYEYGGYDFHQVKAKIFLEMSRHFLLNGTLDFINGDQQRQENLWLSLIYRW